MKKYVLGLAAIGLIVAGSVFHACNKDGAFDTTQTQDKIMARQGEIIGWIIVTSDGIPTSSQDVNICSSPGAGCSPLVTIEYRCACDANYIPPPDAKPVYNSILPNGGNGDSISDIIGRLPLHKLIIDLKDIESPREICSFVQDNRDNFIEIIDENLIESVIIGKYNISVVSEQTSSNKMFRYIICFSESTNGKSNPISGNIVTFTPITYIYELD